MHPAEELQAVLSLFDGEIHVSERETPEGTEQILKVKRMLNQKFSPREIVLNKKR
jgi:hypothetical protein